MPESDFLWDGGLWDAGLWDGGTPEQNVPPSGVPDGACLVLRVARHPQLVLVVR
jgi:hypothetical protein